MKDKEDMVRIQDKRDDMYQEGISVDLKNKRVMRLGEPMVCHKNRAYLCTPLCPLFGFDEEAVEFYCGPHETIRYDFPTDEDEEERSCKL